MNLTVMNGLTSKLLTDLTTSGISITYAGALTAANLQATAFIDATPHQPSDPYSAFAPPSFTGYATISSVTWSAPYNDQSGDSTLAGPTLSWVSSDSVTTNTVHGVLISDKTTTPKTPLLCFTFDTPVQITQPGDGLVFIPAVSVNGQSITGEGTLVN